MARRRADVSQKLSEVGIFAACSKRDLQRISRLGTEARFPAGRVLMEEGAVGREFLVLFDGRAAVRRSGRKIATLGAGDFVGEIALLDGGPRTATVVTETDVVAEVFDRSEFRSLLLGTPELALRVLAGTAARLRELQPRAL